MKIINPLLIFIVFFLTGCASFSGGPELVLEPDREIDSLRPLFEANQVNDYFLAQTPETRKEIRNKIISTRLYAIDLKFSKYVQSLAKELRSGAFGSDIVSLTLSGVATSIDQGGTTRALSAIDTVIKGGRQSFNKEVLIDKTLDVLLTQMKADRKRLSTQIWQSLAKLSDAEYPLPLALSQLKEYYHVGTIAGALSSLGETASQEAIAASNEFDETIIRIPYGENEYTKILNEYIDAAKTDDDEKYRLEQINAEIKKLGGSISASFLIDTNEAQYTELQKKIIEILNLGAN